jgi:predicted nucleic acid-binding Zn ribbon protein
MAQLLGRLGASASPGTMEVIFTRWDEVVGAEFAQHLQPVRVDGAVLVVGADHPAWATRARMDSAQILARVRVLGDTTIERIEVTIQRP